MRARRSSLILLLVSAPGDTLNRAHPRICEFFPLLPFLQPRSTCLSVVSGISIADPKHPIKTVSLHPSQLLRHIAHPIDGDFYKPSCSTLRVQTDSAPELLCSLARGICIWKLTVQLYSSLRSCSLHGPYCDMWWRALQSFLARLQAWQGCAAIERCRCTSL